MQESDAAVATSLPKGPRSLEPNWNSLYALGNKPRKIDATRIDTLIDRINAKFGYNEVYFGSMQLALEHDAASMRIPFNRIPDT